jgi:hypothetical protein
MKKFVALLVATLIIVSVAGQAKFKMASGYASHFKVKVPEKEWTEWDTTSPPVPVYLDLNFGFVILANGLYDRFVLIKELENKLDSINVLKYKAINSEGVNCKVCLYIYKSGDIIVHIRYSDVEYQYYVSKVKFGYPYYLFKKKEEDKIEYDDSIDYKDKKPKITKPDVRSI